jgi:DNA-directed RNA polymerase specialized sigma24 family protein
MSSSFNFGPELIKRVDTYVRAFTFGRYINWDIQEIKQDCLIRIWNKKEKFDPSKSKNFYAWVHRLCYNLMRNTIRQRCSKFRKADLSSLSNIKNDSWCLAESPWESYVTDFKIGFYPSLTDKEEKVFKLSLSGIAPDLISKKMKTTTRTIYNDLKKIRIKREQWLREERRGN